MSASESSIFKVSDLAQSRTELLEAARHGRARVRDTDGTGLVMLREQELLLLELLAEWARAYSHLQRLLMRDIRPSISDLGDRLAWLRVFDTDDLREFAADLDDALVASKADGEPSALTECLQAWRVTARQLEDPLRRAVLLASHNAADFDETMRPDEPRHELAAENKSRAVH